MKTSSCMLLDIWRFIQLFHSEFHMKLHEFYLIKLKLYISKIIFKVKNNSKLTDLYPK
jgi:hypothetical protein